MNALPAILKFGLPGLAAIVVYLAYQLLLAQTKKEHPNQSIVSTIKAFMALGVALAVISAASGAIELITSLKHQQSLNDLETKLAAAESEITRLKEAIGSQQTVEQLQQKLTAADGEIKRLKEASESQQTLDQLQQKLTAGRQEFAQLESRLAEARKELQERDQVTSAQRVALNRFVADLLEQTLSDFSAKLNSVGGSAVPAVRASLLRRAVFIHMLALQADKSVLHDALETLVDRGHDDIKPMVESIVDDLPKLRVLKLRWLQDKAIPALAEDIRTRNPITQSAPSAEVPLPQEFVIADMKFDEPSARVTDMTRLQEEVDLLKKSI